MLTVEARRAIMFTVAIPGVGGATTTLFPLSTMIGGDSMSAGVGATGAGRWWADIHPVVQNGVGSSRIEAIGAIQGGRPAAVASSLSVPTSDVTSGIDFGPGVTFYPTTPLTPRYYPGYFTGYAGIHGQLENLNGDEIFRRDASGLSQTIGIGSQYVTDVGVAGRTMGQIIWGGHRNHRADMDGDLVVETIQDMVDFMLPGLTGKVTYLVLGLVTGPGAETHTDLNALILDTNSRLASAHPAHFINPQDGLLDIGPGGAFKYAFPTGTPTDLDELDANKRHHTRQPPRL